MNRWILLATVALAFLLQAGCGGDGMANTRSERMHRAERRFQYDMRMYADDVDLFWLNDEHSRLSKYSIP